MIEEIQGLGFVFEFIRFNVLIEFLSESLLLGGLKLVVINSSLVFFEKLLCFCVGRLEFLG